MKKGAIRLFGVLLALSLASYAQAVEEQSSSKPTKLWEKSFSKGQTKVINSAIQTGDGGLLVVGWARSQNSGEKDAWAIRVDRDGNELWERTFGGEGEDAANSVIQTADGGFVIVGKTRSKGEGRYDAWIVKLDKAGNLVWDRTFGGADFDGANSVIQTEDGGFLVVGYTLSWGAGGKDAWVIRLDRSGQKLWEKVFGGRWDDAAYSAAQTADGKFLIAGVRSRSSGSGILNLVPEEDVWLIMVDDDGDEIWEKTYGGKDDDGAISVISTRDGGFLVTGYTESIGPAGRNGWVIKVDKDGNKLWDKVFSKWTEATSAIQVPDGRFIVVGATTTFFEVEAGWVTGLDENGSQIWVESFRGKEPRRVVQTDAISFAIAGRGKEGAWVVKFKCSCGKPLSDFGYSKVISGELVKVWDKTIGGEGDDAVYSVIRTVDGNFLAVGSTSSKGAGKSDAWVVKFDGKGNVVWDKTFGGADFDGANSVVETGDGGFLVVGYTFSKGAQGDAWVMKLDERGNLIWDKTFGSEGADSATSIVKAEDGGFLVVGTTKSRKGKDSDVLVVKLDREGSKKWSKIFDGCSVWRKTFGECFDENSPGIDDSPSSVIHTSDEGFLIVGETREPTQSIAWIIKIDKNGNKLWEKGLGDLKENWASSAVETQDGNFIVLINGYFKGMGYSSWLVKLDKDGNEIWNKTIFLKERPSTELLSIIPSGRRKFLTVGRVYTGKENDWDAVIVKLDEKGNNLQEGSFGGKEFDSANSAVQIREGEFIVVGYKGSDAWIFKLVEKTLKTGERQEKIPLLNDILEQDKKIKKIFKTVVKFLISS